MCLAQITKAQFDEEDYVTTRGEERYSHNDYETLFPSFPTLKLHTSELLNGFLAFFALFRGGRHPYLQPYIKIMSTITSLFDGEDPEGNTV
jgi:hypothetical protein